MKRQSLTSFIKNNRQGIDDFIRKNSPNNRYFNDEERRLWVLNYESLYYWAISEGVRME